MSQKNDHDFRDQHKILVLEMLTNPGGEMVTKILLHSVMCVSARRSKCTLTELTWRPVVSKYSLTWVTNRSSEEMTSDPIV